MTAAGKDASYTYDAEGHRIGKHYEDILYFIPEGGISYTTVRFPVDTEYFYLGDTLSHVTMEGYRSVNDTEIEVNVDMRFTYDAVGPLSVNYNGAEYFYLKNAQGDVMGIVNAAGTQVVAYTYDAWGKLLSTTGSMAGTLGEYNPLRYRGYVYDTETGLYYLNSRYYNPETGRFINADGVIAGVGGNLKGYNTFSYCFNNPVNMNDENGCWPQWIKNAVKWVTKNVVMPVVKTAQEVLSKIDVTYSQGINISGTPSAFVFNLQAGLSIDTKGNVAIQSSIGGGVTGGSPSASITAYKSVTTAPSINSLDGDYYQIGGSAGIPVAGIPLAVGGDFSIIPDSTLDKRYVGATANIGFGIPGAEFHVEWGSTATWNETRFNLFDVADGLFIRIMEW